MAIAFCTLQTYGQADSVKLENLSLKELLSVKVTTASRTAQELGLTPASVMLISKEQIKIRGYQSLMDVLTDLGFNMDFNNPNTELLYGQPQDPARVMAGVSLGF